MANKLKIQVAADLGVANLQSYSGAIGTCYSLNSNLEHINNKTTIAEYRQEVANLLQKAQKLYGLNREMLEEVLKHEYLINSELI